VETCWAKTILLSQTNQQMFWLFFIIQFSFAGPQIQRWWSCWDEAMCWAFL
jgi:hypothetical protein